jgi:hypothetical protein
VAALLVAGSAEAARTHAFSARYAGTGSGHVGNGKASGSAAIRGSGRPIGAGTLTGSATGTFTTQTCVVFSGRARLTGRRGSLRLVVHGARACASEPGARLVSFSGTAKVVGSTGVVGRASGMLSFHGTYETATRAVTVSFSGRLKY